MGCQPGWWIYLPLLHNLAVDPTFFSNQIVCWMESVFYWLCGCRDQLRCPGQYSALEAFFEQRKGLLPARTTWNNMVAAVSTPKHFMSPEMKVAI